MGRFSDAGVKARAALTSKEGFKSIIKTKETETARKNQSAGFISWSNEDLDPSPPSQRNWSGFYFFAFQFSIAFSPTTYNLGASLVAVGLTWWTILIAAILGSFLCCLVLFFNSRGASNYHVGFPTFVRISAGMYGSLWFIFIRCIVAILYMATQSYYASELLNVCLRCIFGHKWTDIPNHLPASASITSQGLLAFFIFWFLQLPFAWLHPSKAGPVFAVKSWIVPPALFATMIWALAFWNLWDFYSAVLDDHWNPAARFLVFCGAFIQVYATLATNMSSNSIPVGCDLAGLFPRYFTIVRGQVLCALLAICVVPWKLVNSAQTFLTFLGSYLCFICPIVACMMVDYWLARSGNVHVPSLYVCKPGAPYYYTRGFNPRAYAAWTVGVVLVISGISGVLSPGSISQTAVNIYNMGFLLSTSAAAVTYFVLVKIWPVQVWPAGPREGDLVVWEGMRASEGFFEEDEKPAYLEHGEVIVAEEGMDGPHVAELTEKSVQ